MPDTCARGNCLDPKEMHDDREGCLVMKTRYGFGAPIEGRQEQCDCDRFVDDVRGGEESYPMERYG